MHDGKINHWNVAVKAPSETPYEGGIFQLEIVFLEGYPQTAPTIRFKTRIYHPNVNMDAGRICHSILDRHWRPDRHIAGNDGLLYHIYALMVTPEFKDPLNSFAAQQYLESPSKFKEAARQYTEEHAKFKEGLPGEPSKHFKTLEDMAKSWSNGNK